jgi:hypothetical protein
MDDPPVAGPADVEMISNGAGWKVGTRSRSRTGACDLDLNRCLPLQLLHDRVVRR